MTPMGSGRRDAVLISRAVLMACLWSLLGVSVAGAATELSIAAEGGFFSMMNANKSAKAIFDGSTGGGTFGGSVRLGLGDHFFVGIGGRYFKKEGQRVFVADANSPVFRLGHPLEIKAVPIYALVGYRFRPGRLLVPYAALGFGLTSFSEQSTVGGVTEKSDESKASALVAAGLEVGRSKLRFGLELAYSTVPDTIGVGGVSQIYNEKDVGGFTAIGRIIFVP